MAKKKRSTKKKTSKRRKAKKSSFLSYLSASIVIIILFAGTYLFIRLRDDIFPPPIPEEKTTKSVPSNRLPEEKEGFRVVTLYFSNKSGLNLVEKRQWVRSGTIEDEIRDIVKSLIDGQKEAETRTIPYGTRLLNVKVKKDIAFLDLSREISSRHPGGSRAEIETIYSIVNSIVFNFPGIEKVQILIEGKKRKTLAGHIDISLPLKGNKAL